MGERAQGDDVTYLVIGEPEFDQVGERAQGAKITYLVVA